MYIQQVFLRNTHAHTQTHTYPISHNLPLPLTVHPACDNKLSQVGYEVQSVCFCCIYNYLQIYTHKRLSWSHELMKGLLCLPKPQHIRYLQQWLGTITITRWSTRLPSGEQGFGWFRNRPHKHQAPLLFRVPSTLSTEQAFLEKKIRKQLSLKCKAEQLGHDGKTPKTNL